MRRDFYRKILTSLSTSRLKLNVPSVLLIKEQKPEECDATEDKSMDEREVHKKIN
jgi:hypothetical protein